MRFAFIDAEKAHLPVRRLCRALEVSPSGFYAWRRRARSARQREDARLTVEIRAVHRASRGTYGNPRVHAVLRATHRVSRKRVARLMRHSGLHGCRLRQVCRTTQPDPRTRAAPLLTAGVPPTAPDQQWAADITYIRTDDGWLYLAVILDVYSRRVIGWALDSRLQTPLVLAALEMALGTHRPAQAIHHSDSEYMGACFRAA